MQKDSIGIVIADDHPVVRIGLRNLLQAEPSFSVLGEAADGRDTIDMVKQLDPDVLLLDLAMPRVSGLDVMRELTPNRETMNVILLTANIERQQLLSALQLGARGVVLKDSAATSLVEAIHAVSEGKYWIEQQKVGDLVQSLEQSRNSEAVDSANEISRETEVQNEPKVADAVSSSPSRAVAVPSRGSERRISFGDVVVDFSRMELMRGGQTTALTKKQFQMLKFLWRNPERVISRQELLEEIWGYNNYASTRIIDNVILQLRQIVEVNPAEPVHLRTVHGMGYKFVP
jgi:DNA-binding response OmpR family regulator